MSIAFLNRNNAGTARPISPHDESQIAFYFAAQSLFFRSTFGPMLDRAENAAFGSNGKRIPLAPPIDSLPPVRGRMGTLRREQLATDEWLVMPVRSQRSDSPGYTVDDEQLTRFASACRRMLAVERSSLGAKRTLEAYYGARGDHWAAFGEWPGRVAAVFLLTRSGEALLERDRLRVVRKEKAKPGDTWESLAARYCGGQVTADELRAVNKATGAPVKGREYGMPSHEQLSPDERLKNILTSHKVQPSPARTARITAAQDEAEAMLARARGLWMGTGASPGVDAATKEAA